MNPARTKMDSPTGRAAYLRVFCAHLLTDEAFEDLTREEFGSVMLLIFHAWVKRGSLPGSPRSLARLARCTEGELQELLERWPKLVNLELMDPDSPKGRVTIPYLWREWVQVMGFYALQKERSIKGLEALEAKKMGDPMGNPKGDPMGNPNKDQDKDKDKDQDQDKEKIIATITAWNDMAIKAGIHRCKGGKKIIATIKTRLVDPSFLPQFLDALPYIAGSPWCKGQNDRGWIADLEWILRPGNIERYSGRKPEISKAASRVPSHRSEADAALFSQL